MKIPKRIRPRVSRWPATALIARRACFLVAFICLGPGFTTLSAQSNGPKKKSIAKKNEAPAAPKTPVPFHAGETLDFSGQWLGMSGAITAELSVPEQRAVYGLDAWHLRAQLHTNNPLRYLVAVDDEFDAYDAQTDLLGMQFEMYLHESGKSETHLFRLASGPVEARANVADVHVPQGTRDALGMMYFLRTVDWQRTNEVRGPVFDGRKVYELRAQMITPLQDVSVAAGKFSATSVSVRVFDNGAEMTNTKLKLWIARDAAHTPVLLEMELPIGTGRVELVKATPGRP